ncbi:MAG: restriction endonuclease subunit R [Oculatellaceae cyanobacterium Prado106]|jgi:hypothetical protein|nr:restriction endonuclease subunit R [Oculatellaceae cyanobacterium Prado106]
MPQTIYAKDISLFDLKEKFGLRAVQESFLEQWSVPIQPLTELEQLQLARIISNYQNLSQRRPMSEETVKMVILSPMLDLAGFYQPPFDVETEKPIRITAEDEGAIVKGKIDVLIVQKKLWILVIESKQTGFDVMVALPQALACMLANPNATEQTYGLLVSGREFVFVKLNHAQPNQPSQPTYSISQAFSIIPPVSQIGTVLQHLKQLAQMLKTA